MTKTFNVGRPGLVKPFTIFFNCRRLSCNAVYTWNSISVYGNIWVNLFHPWIFVFFFQCCNPLCVKNINDPVSRGESVWQYPAVFSLGYLGPHPDFGLLPLQLTLNSRYSPEIILNSVHVWKQLLCILPAVGWWFWRTGCGFHSSGKGEITGKMCQGVVPTCQQTSCSPSQNPEGNCSVWNTEAGRQIHSKIPNNDQLLNIDRAKKVCMLLTEEAASIALTAAWKTFLGSRRLVVPLSTILLS